MPNPCAAEASATHRPANYASPRRLAAMGLIASVLALFGCDQQKVDEAMKQKMGGLLGGLKIPGLS